MSNSAPGGNTALVIVGMCGSGKSSLASFLADRGWPVVRFGDATMTELGRRGLPVTEANERAIREELRRERGMAAFAELSLPAIRHGLERSGRVVIDGLYSWTEYKLLKERLDARILVIAIFTPRAERYRRLSVRPVRPLTPVEAESRDHAEIERLEKGGPISYADHTLMNDGTIPELEASLRKVLQGEGMRV